MKNKRVLPAFLGAVALTLGLATVTTNINKEVVNAAEETTVTATLSFADVANRTEYSTEQQVWEQNGIILTNDKGSSTSNVADYSNPARFYKSSKITVEAPGNISSITFTCSSSSYATALNDSITKGTSSVSESNVTVTLPDDELSKSYTIDSLTGGQVRMKSLSITYAYTPSYASSQDIRMLMEEYYNDGTYTKKTQIYLKNEAIEDIDTHFHGGISKDRTTYYTKENGKDALYMADLDGTISSINSGYSTINETNLEAVQSKFPTAGIGHMAHFKYNQTNEKVEYDYIVKTVTGGIGEFYHALDEVFAQDYFGENLWIDNEDGSFEYTVKSVDDSYLDFFLAFAAPCLKPTILTETNYIDVDGLKLIISTDTNELAAKEYLSLKMILTEGNKGLVDNDDRILSEARIYAGNEMFSEDEHTCSYTEATCTEDGVCETCGEVGTPALGHTAANAEGKCERCGTSLTESNAPVTATKSVADLITEYGWTGSTTKQEFKLDDVVTVKINGGSNTGKAYNGDHIRIYATDSPAGTITISVLEGYELVSVKISTVTGTYAFLYVDGTTTDICNNSVAVSGQSVLINSVLNGSNGKQARVTAFEVVYKQS